MEGLCFSWTETKWPWKKKLETTVTDHIYNSQKNTGWEAKTQPNTSWQAIGWHLQQMPYILLDDHWQYPSSRNKIIHISLNNSNQQFLDCSQMFTQVRIVDIHQQLGSVTLLNTVGRLHLVMSEFDVSEIYYLVLTIFLFTLKHIFRFQYQKWI